MTAVTRSIRLAALCLGIAALGACGGGSSDGPSGALSLSMADTPVDNATSVVVDFTGIELHNTNGSMVNINFPSAKQIDLLKLQNGVTGALTQGESVPAGNYDWMRLDVLASKDTQGESYITLATGAQYPLYIPSGAQTGLKLVSPFTVAQGSTTQLVIEFNLRQSVTSTDGQNYVLKPALRLVDQLQVGTLAVNVDLAALTSQQLGSGTQVSQCKGGLFLFSGAAVTPQNGGGPNLVDFEPIPYDGTTAQVSLSIPFVATGSYTVAATCNYDLYDPATAPGQTGYQTLHWTLQGNVSVTANATATVALPSATTSNVVN